MKRYLLIITVMLLSASSYAQKIRFTDRSNAWLFYIEGEPGDWGKYLVTYTHHDTILHGHTYHEMNYHAISWSFIPHVVSGVNYVREDTVTGIVYRILDYSLPPLDTVERVLYNYNWQKGDTIHTYQEGTRNSWLIIDSVSSIIINGLPHKIWYFYKRDTGTISNTEKLENYIIEGIGCTGGIDYERFRYVTFEFDSRLLCFRNQGQFPFVSISGGQYPDPIGTFPLARFNSFTNGSGCDLKVEYNTLNNVPIVVKPNPNNGKFSIVLPTNNERYCAVTVSNMMGQIVQQLRVPTGQTMEVHMEVPDGVYLLHMTIGNNHYNERIAVQR